MMQPGTAVILRRRGRALSGLIGPVVRNGTRGDSGVYQSIATLPLTARSEWWTWKGWEVIDNPLSQGSSAVEPKA